MKQTDKDVEYDKYRYKRCIKCGEIKGRSEDYRSSSDGKGSPICFDCEDPSVKEAAKKAELELFALPSSKPPTHWEKWWWVYILTAFIAVLFYSHGLDFSAWWEDVTGPTAVLAGGGGMLLSAGVFLAVTVPEASQNYHQGIKAICVVGFLVSSFIFAIGYDNFY